MDGERLNKVFSSLYSFLQDGHGLNLGIINEAIKISAVPEWVKGKYVNTRYLFQVTGRYIDIK